MLQSLIENNRNGRNVEKLASISFSHAAFLVIDYHEKQLMHDLGIIIDMMEKNNSNFESKSISNKNSNKSVDLINTDAKNFQHETNKVKSKEFIIKDFMYHLVLIIILF